MEAVEHGRKEKIKIRVKKKKPFNLQAKSLIIGCLVILILVFAGYFAYEILTSKPAEEWQEVSAKAGSSVQLPKDDAPQTGKGFVKMNKFKH